MERHRDMKRAHHLSNVQVALQFLESRRVSEPPHCYMTTPLFLVKLYIAVKFYGNK